MLMDINSLGKEIDCGERIVRQQKGIYFYFEFILDYNLFRSSTIRNPWNIFDDCRG